MTLSARQRLAADGYAARTQNLRGFVADAGQIATFAVSEAKGLTFTETVRVRDLLEAAIDLLNEQAVLNAKQQAYWEGLRLLREQRLKQGTK